MKFVCALACLLAGLTVCPNARADADPMLWAYQYVLATATDPTQIIPITMNVRGEKELRVPELLDVLAEFAVISEPEGKPQQLARKEMIESLGRYGGPRYETTLRKIASEWVPSPARESARQFIGAKITGDQYIPGTVKLAEMRDRFAADAAAAAAPTKERARHLAEFPLDGTPAELVAWAGMPQAVSSRFPQSPAGGLQRLAFYYRGIGRVMFNHVFGQGWHAKQVNIDPLAFEDFMPYREAPEKYQQPDRQALAMMQLMSGSPIALRVVLDAVEEQDRATPEFLDTTAELLLAHRTETMEPQVADVYAWMCVLLARDGGPRYAQVLATVAQSTPNEHLRKHAGAKVRAGKNPNATPYAAGSVSLQAQRAKYPSIYPTVSGS
jgi:hypothetical protein